MSSPAKTAKATKIESTHGVLFMRYVYAALADIKSRWDESQCEWPIGIEYHSYLSMLDPKYKPKGVINNLKHVGTPSTEFKQMLMHLWEAVAEEVNAIEAEELQTIDTLQMLGEIADQYSDSSLITTLCNVAPPSESDFKNLLRDIEAQNDIKLDMEKRIKYRENGFGLIIVNMWRCAMMQMATEYAYLCLYVRPLGLSKNLLSSMLFKLGVNPATVRELGENMRPKKEVKKKAEAVAVSSAPYPLEPLAVVAGAGEEVEADSYEDELV